MPWEFNSNEPIYLQLIKELELKIVSGTYPPGSQLPGVRALALDAAVNPNTVQRAMQELERLGLVYAQRTSGRFVTEDQDKIHQIKMQLAGEQVTEFLDGMKKLGISVKDAMALLSSAEEKE